MHRDASADLEGRVRELEAQLEDQRRLTYGALHDLKSPVRGIAQLAEWIAEELGGEADPEVAEWLTLLQQRSRRLTVLVQDLLSYILADAREPDLVAVSTRDLVQEIWVDIHPPVDVDLLIPGAMPVLVADHLALRQVFANLLENAVKYRGEGPGQVIVQSRELDDSYELAVIDDGPGIPDKAVDKVFDPFYRGQSKIEGSGVGLALVARVVKSMGAKIWVESELGEGSTFLFTWPKLPLSHTRA